MRVCHIISGDLWAGAEAQVATLLSVLQKESSLSLDAVVLNPGRLHDELQRAGVATHLIDESQHSFLSLRRAVAAKLNEIQPDVLHSHRYKENILAAIVAPSSVKARVQTIHGKEEPFSGIAGVKMFIYRALNRYFTERTYNTIVCVSEDVAKTAHRRFTRPTITTIHNGIACREPAPTASKTELRATLELPQETIVFCIVGRLTPIKNIALAIRAFSHAHTSLPNSHLLIVGDGPERASLEALAQSLAITNSCSFLGYRDDVHALLNASDVLLLSSDSEGIPMVLLEAMSLAMPVIATHVGGIPEVISEPETGILVPRRDEAALCSAMCKLATNEATRKQLAANAQTHVQAHFSIDTIALRYLELYRTML